MKNHNLYKILLIILYSLFFIHNSYSQSDTIDNHVRIVFYNTENFFDTFKDSLKNDSDFTPVAARHWNFHRYYTKLNHISKVLIAVGDWEAPPIIGLCEIENKLVLLELIHKTPLKKFEYSIIHYPSPDRRGLAVALLYRPEIMTPLFTLPVHIRLPSDTAFRTRDILYVKALLFNKDTLHLFINHFPSRVSGKAESENKRVYAASVLKSKIDSVLTTNKNANILIMGDFNDEPADSSISKVLNAKCISKISTDAMPGVSNMDSAGAPLKRVSYPGLSTIDYGLINLMCQNKQAGEWTYLYNLDSKLFASQKNILDQFIVTSNLLHNSHGLTLKDNKAYIFKKDWLIQIDKYGNESTFSTYKGYKYLGGFSDHLPVYLDLILKN